MISINFFRSIAKQTALCGCFSALVLMVNCEEITEQPDQLSDSFDENGVVVGKTPLWTFDTSTDRFNNVNFVPIFHNGMVAVAGSPSEGKGMMVTLDLETGEEIWRWSDYFEGHDFEEILSREKLNRKNNIVIYNRAYRFCAVNLDNGTTIWKNQLNGAFPSASLQVLDEHYYFSLELERNENRYPSLIKGDVNSTDYEVILEAPIEQIQQFNQSFGTLYSINVYKENNDVHAFLGFSENIDVFTSKHFNSYLSYNITQGTFDFEKVRLPDTVASTFGGRPVMIDDIMILNGNETVYGINKYTGKVVWERGDFASGTGDGILVFEGYKGRFFASNILGSTRRTMELDPKTGATKWLDVGNGGSVYPPLHFLNDVLYFISRGDGLIYAYDINGGELLWKLKSPDGEGFMTMRVHKAENEDDEDMLVACSWKNAYRFEPAR